MPITVTATPKAGQGTDVDPDNNTATAQVKFTGSAALTYTLTPAKTKVELGASTTVTLTVHNAGPQPTGETVAFSVILGDTFTITGFTGNTTPPPDFGGPAQPATPTAVLWFTGNIPAGQSVSAVLTIKAVQFGTSEVALFGYSEAADPNCPDEDCEPATASVEAVAVAVAPAAPAAPASDGSSPLADTGPASGPELGVGAVLVLSGGLLLLLGRRRRVS